MVIVVIYTSMSQVKYSLLILDADCNMAEDIGPLLRTLNEPHPNEVVVKVFLHKNMRDLFLEFLYSGVPKTKLISHFELEEKFPSSFSNVSRPGTTVPVGVFSSKKERRALVAEAISTLRGPEYDRIQEHTTVQFETISSSEPYQVQTEEGSTCTSEDG
ncbi:uncharacterized protein LOC115627006 isoform X2 [Scaptodrosophila lebanonensis]|nr:uncharacterized protein LOC115627006 isoform X2 [Scaptodrosophila lebanonensis]